VLVAVCVAASRLGVLGRFINVIAGFAHVLAETFDRFSGGGHQRRGRKEREKKRATRFHRYPHIAVRI